MTGFDDLDKAGKEQSSTTAENADDERERSSVSEGESSDAESHSEIDTSEPAFPFNDAIQAQIYPRQTTHDEFEDFLAIDVKRLLRDRNIRNETGRELHEAVLHVAMNHPEEIVEEVINQRQR